MADSVRSWLGRAATRSSLGPALVSWALSFGDDWSSAWEQCERADFLALLGGVGAIDTVRLRALTCLVAGEMPLVAPEYAEPLAEINALANRWRLGELLPEELPPELQATADALRDEDDAARERETAAAERLATRISAVVNRSIARADLVGRTFVVELGPDGALAELGAIHVARHRRGAATYAMKCAFAALLYGKVAERGSADALLARSGGAHFSAWRAEASLRSRERGDTLAVLAADVYRYASVAYAWRAGGERSALEAALVGLVAAVRASCTTTLEDPLGALTNGIVPVMERRAALAQRRMAHELRASIPFASLDLPMGRLDGHTALDSDPSSASELRAVIRASLRELLAILGSSHRGALHGSVEAALLAVGAPSAPGRAVVAVVEDVQRALAATFLSEGWSTTTGIGRTLVAVTAKLERAARRYATLPHGAERES